jgi:hypothetical protein
MQAVACEMMSSWSLCCIDPIHEREGDEALLTPSIHRSIPLPCYRDNHRHHVAVTAMISRLHPNCLPNSSDTAPIKPEYSLTFQPQLATTTRIDDKVQVIRYYHHCHCHYDVSLARAFIVLVAAHFFTTLTAPNASHSRSTCSLSSCLSSFTASGVLAVEVVLDRSDSESRANAMASCDESSDGCVVGNGGVAGNSGALARFAINRSERATNCCRSRKCSTAYHCCSLSSSSPPPPSLSVTDCACCTSCKCNW